MRLTVDTNILVYALDRDSPDKREIATIILKRGRDVGMILTTQVLGEFVNAVRRKNPDALEEALALVEQWPALFPVVWTNPDHIAVGGRLAVRHRL